MCRPGSPQGRHGLPNTGHASSAAAVHCGIQGSGAHLFIRNWEAATSERLNSLGSRLGSYQKRVHARSQASVWGSDVAKCSAAANLVGGALQASTHSYARLTFLITHAGM